MKGCIKIDETVSMDEPKFRRKIKERGMYKKKGPTQEDKELATYRKDYRYGAENDDDETEDFAWQDGIEQVKHESKGEKIKNFPWEEMSRHEEDMAEKMPKNKRKMLVKMLVKKKMHSKNKKENMSEGY